MYQFRLTRDRAEWERLIECFPPELRDVHFLPGMSFPYECMGYEAHLAVVEGNNCEAGEGLAIQPLLVDWDRHQVRHAHNFGGPLATCDDAGNILSCHIRNWADEHKLRGQVTLLPFLYNQAQWSGGATPEKVRDAVWVDLVDGAAAPRQTTMHMVVRALDNGYLYRPCVSTRETIMLFQRVYWTTMSRVGASDDWIYPSEFFQRVLKETLGHLMLFSKLGEQPEGGCILVGGGETCYYHWAGTLSRDRSGLSHMMVWRAIEWARNQGFKRLYLGGGRTPGDGLEVFKRGFSKLVTPVLRYEIAS